ncbi:porin family protein [Flavobacterium sp. MK4S-17]|uniref:porin family protein n=1 Tax=Flavobacterium sp. MK4S-17 TaxID=2543737 RepID=UPI001359F527|nr:porin family protein [Flavobacterium sp. MK4S-17]
MRHLHFILFQLLFVSAFAQELPEEGQPVEIDSLAPVADPKYREDQFYATISYNLMQGKPGGYSQNSFSTGLSFGFLRDMPVNEKRTYAIAAGLGYSYNNIKHNLKVTQGGGDTFYEIVPEGDFDKNKLVLHYLELPIEFRWRNSNAISHKFARIYTGFKVSYLFADKAQFYSGDGDIKIKGNDDLNKFIYGAYISVGWNTWNFYAYYSLNPIFSADAKFADGEKVNLNSLKLGLAFYIL